MRRPVATLNLPEIKIQQLHSKGYIFIEDINLESVKSDINLSTEEWKKLVETVETKTALDLCETETISKRIVTFSSDLDAILGGGIPCKMITEVTGLPGSGKTQFCLQLCVSIQVPDCFGGNDGQAVFIDTSLGFNPYRLAEMAKGCIKYCQDVATTYNSFEMFEELKSLTLETFLNGVHYIRTVQFTDILATINTLKKLLHQNNNIKLVLIDNITEPVKSVSTDYFDRIKNIYSYLLELEKLAQIYNFAVGRIVRSTLRCATSPPILMKLCQKNPLKITITGKIITSGGKTRLILLGFRFLKLKLTLKHTCGVRSDLSTRAILIEDPFWEVVFKQTSLILWVLSRINCVFKRISWQSFIKIGAEEAHRKIVLTNDMTLKFNEDGSSYETPCLGDSFAHRINSRIKLERQSHSQFRATVIKNVSRPLSSARFQIVESGIRDIN